MTGTRSSIYLRHEGVTRRRQAKPHGDTSDIDNLEVNAKEKPVRAKERCGGQLLSADESLGAPCPPLRLNLVNPVTCLGPCTNLLAQLE